MSGASKIKIIASVVGIAMSMAATATMPTLRDKLARLLGITAPGGAWRLLALFLAALNFKNLPFAWHARVFRAMIYQVYLQPTKPIPPRALFRPIITNSHCPLFEIDYNMHKSNSTYFADLDVSRTHLVSALLREGIRAVNKGKDPDSGIAWGMSDAGRGRKPERDATAATAATADPYGEAFSARGLTISPLGASGVETVGGTGTLTGTATPTTMGASASASVPPPLHPPSSTQGMSAAEFEATSKGAGRLVVALGSVACFFHREIAPYKKYEIWTRLLTYDRKWLYLVSFFVERGAFRPVGDDEGRGAYILQPWKRGRKAGSPREETSEDSRQKIRRKIYASSIAKYVIKKGRLTVPPERVLTRCGMLPEKPAGVTTSWPGDASGQCDETRESGLPRNAGGNGGTSAAATAADSSGMLNVLEESLFPEEDEADGGEWTWEKMEKERQRGMRFARVYDSLDCLREGFDGGEKGVLGTFSDFVGGI